jgi:hypothetical protein
MKLSSGNLHFWNGKAPLLAWRNVKYHRIGEGQNVPAPTGGFSVPRIALFQRRASF